jgi:cephalosporin-C deacetylase
MSIPTTHPYSFDPTYGFGLDRLRAMGPPEAPPRFDDFWRARYAAALGFQPQPQLSESSAHHPDWRVHDVVYRSTGGVPIGGWLLLPRAGAVRNGLVVGHGYGGRDAPDFDIPVEETAVLFPCFRGLSRSRLPQVSTDPALHVLHDIEDPDHYVLGGCVEDIWVAVSVLTALHPTLDGRIGYSGTSFGGGIGALALAFDPRIARGLLVVPTFGNIPLWLTLPTVGSGNAVQNYRKTYPGVLETISLFDSAVAATRIAAPTLCAVARFDPAVAPPCQFSVANARPTINHHETFVLDAGHFDYPGMVEQHALLTEQIRRFFRVT